MNAAQTPRVSVVMSVYNGERFLTAAIQSILGQTLADFELVVVDDGSDDSTAAILAALASQDRRIVVHRQANLGLSAAVNRGVELARAPLVARIDADDLALPERLQRQVDFLDRHPSVGLVGGAVVFIDEAGRVFAEALYPTSDLEIRRAFEHSTPFVHSAVTFRRAAFEGAGGYRSAFVDAEDLDLWLRIAEAHQVSNLRDPVVKYRIHAGQSTYRNLERQAVSVLAARTSWRARAAGRPDPFLDVARLDPGALEAAGLTDDDVTAELVPLTLWLAKTIGRAGGRKVANELFAFALDRACVTEEPTLIAEVRRQKAQADAARGRRSRDPRSLLRLWRATK